MHVRSPPKGEETKDNTPDIPDWHKRVTELIKKRIEESKAGAEQLQSLQQATDEIQSAFDEQMFKNLRDEGGKFACPFCEKYFAGQTFVIKHMKNKHDDHKDVVEVKRKVIDRLTRRNYARDKYRITNTPNQHSYRRPSGPRRGGQRMQSQGPRADYRDLDDPKREGVAGNTPAKLNRAVIDYADLWEWPIVIIGHNQTGRAPKINKSQQYNDSFI